MYPQTEEPQSVTPAPLIQDGAVADIYGVGGGGDLMDEYTSLPIIIEKRSLVPWQQGVAPFTRMDVGTNRNRVDPEMEEYDERIFALTLVHNGPQYYGVVQHTLQENAEQFSVETAQKQPLPVDSGKTIPFNDITEYQLSGGV